MNASAPLLLFDSGVGGLSILEPLRGLLPHAPIVYAADNAGFPYGGRGEEEIAARVPALLGRLVERYRPRLAIIACNTASTIALETIRAALDIPVVGTVPAIKPAAELSSTRVIGILGTQATVRQPYVDRLAARFASDCTVVRHGSARLVELAEGKLRGHDPVPGIVREELDSLWQQPGGQALDVVVLACTHFPLLADELAQAAPAHVHFVDGGSGIARRAASLTEGQRWPASPAAGTAVFTRADDTIEPLRPALLARGITELTVL